MPFSNVQEAAAQWEKIKGKEAQVGAQFFIRAFKIPGVQDAFAPFKGKTVTEADLTTHGKIVMEFLRDKLIHGSADDAMKGYVTSHKQKPGLSVALVKSTRDELVGVFADNGMDRGVMETFVGDFLDTMAGLW